MSFKVLQAVLVRIPRYNLTILAFLKTAFIRSMKGELVKLCLFAFAIAGIQSTESTAFQKGSLKVTPEYQKVYEYDSVVIVCESKENNWVYWDRPKGFLFPKQVFTAGKALTIRNITLEDAGDYICLSKEKGFPEQARVAHVDVIRRVNSITTGFKPTTSGPILSTVGWTSTINSFNLSATITPYPCLYGVCNGTCCQKDFAEIFFDCANGQKIPKSLVCNRENDCKDNSDESACSPWSPKITVLPALKVELFCSDQSSNQTRSDTLILECESVGHPLPLIRWKKCGGHVPSKCQQFSKGGHGTLICPNFQQSDQGTYSCIAENTVKLAESQPKSLAKCSNSINCQGFKVINEEQIEHCLECYCSGKSKTCHNLKSNASVTKLSFPESKTKIVAKKNGDVIFVPTKTVLGPSVKLWNGSRAVAQEITYCTLNENDFKDISFLKSFGRSLTIPGRKGKPNFLEKAPDLIIGGNGLYLMYSANLILPPRYNIMDLSVKFWPGNWHHLNKQAATRNDLMKVLSNVEALFLRCEYEEGKIMTRDKNTTILLESSVVTDFTNSVSYLEKCFCPLGYDGLSCESCAAGYAKKLKGDDFICEPTNIPLVCKEGYRGKNCSECDGINGYQKKGSICVKTTCHPEGSASTSPNGKCICKEGVIGEFCDQCATGFFHLHKTKGCLKCWCSGLTNQCKSSPLYRTVISNTPRGGYNSSDGRNFWLLPSDFNGNRLTSYGGYLNYTMKYKPEIPKENTSLTVEFLSMDDVTLIYTHSSVNRSSTKDEKSWFVPLTEVDWRKSDRSLVSRGEFLAVLSKIKAIYLESPYHLSSGQANLTSVRISSAGPSESDESLLALEVEQCTCPRGYTGLSCESCSQGYYKKRNGTIFQCIECKCSYCDPELGCRDCPELTYRDNPEEERMPVCKPCPCNGNGVSCAKDDYNQIFCRCKSGFTGMRCEILIPKEKDELTIRVSPRRIKGKKVGTAVHFNCSLISNEEMTLSVRTSYSSSSQSLRKNSYNDSGIRITEGRELSKNFEIVLESGLEAVECLVHDSQGRLVGHVVALVEDLITVIRPVKITNCYSDRIDLKESESKEIICEATGSPSPTINWYKRNNNLPAQKVDTSAGVHTIESASLKDNGTVYTCVAENSEGDRAICAKILIVRKKCEVINIFPKNIKVEEGKNISIQCKTTAKSPVVWTKYDSDFRRETSVFSLRTSVKDGYLKITNATASDSGTYICTAKGEMGNINESISVIVKEKTVPPMVSILEYDKELKPGESFEVNCNATGKPDPKVTWFKVNGSLESNVLIIGKRLKIKEATVKNSGIYGCEAQSSSGNAFSYVSIEVTNNIPPTISISEESIKAYEGEEVSITCLTSGFPRPKISWLASNITFEILSSVTDQKIHIEPFLTTKEEIRLKVTKDMDDVIITCIADNTEGKAKAETKIKVLQSKGGINETVEFVPIGSYFELSCDFSAETTWKKLTGEPVDNECIIPNGLMIPSVQNQHNGTYVCATNSGSKKIINLIVVGFVPKFSSSSMSYLVLPVHIKSNNKIHLELSFKASEENGFLLQEENGELEIYLEKGIIHLSIHPTKGAPLDIEMSNKIVLRKWYFLVVYILENNVDVTIYDEDSSIFAKKTERLENFKVKLDVGRHSFFLGASKTKTRHHKIFSRRYQHFDGCISRLQINYHEFDIIKEGSYSKNVTLCRRCSEESLCSEKGKCLDAPTQYGFICVCPNDLQDKKTCPASCTGRGCQTQLDLCKELKPCSGAFLHKCTNQMYRLQCECAYGYTGTTCEKVQEYSICAGGNGFVKLPSLLLKRELGLPEIIKMSFTLQEPNGQLLWQGNRVNYLSIAVREGKLQYVYFNQNTMLEIHAARRVELNQKYSFSVKRIGNTAILELNRPNQVDSQPEVYRNFSLKISTNRVTGDIYLGNVPRDLLLVGHYGLNGCIHNVALGGKSYINLPENELERSDVFSPKQLYHNPYYDSYESEYELDSDYNNFKN